MFQGVSSIRDVIEAYRSLVPDLGMFFLLDVWVGLINAFGHFWTGLNLNIVAY